MPSATWFVYFLRCADNSLYAGVTTDLARRVHEHNQTAKGAKYTRVRRPVSLAYAEPAAHRKEACQREYYLRKLSKKQKEQLVAQFTLEKEVQV
ncbi:MULTISPECIES: GIY-YIG nuclease family protein [Thalassotalea]|uniref:GIY-YIG nuclease family protein n=1 Tax=Thalassotalea TaxID=1518149 RepID=UPI0009434B33|nr:MULTISPECIES: GIY-YIG nuclease family protein [Thalassotalea]OKY26014.1 endonuclease [Thalassotalea sp. PP2-459]